MQKIEFICLHLFHTLTLQLSVKFNPLQKHQPTD